MIKKGIDLSYKVDPYGTEEIISSAANSCAPILTIDYGDEVQTDAEFTIRPTKGSLDTNISDVASINPIKGNTVAWNQLFSSNDVQCAHQESFTQKDGGFDAVFQASSNDKYAKTGSVFGSRNKFYVTFYYKSNYDFSIQNQSGTASLVAADSWTKYTFLGARNASWAYSGFYWFLYQETESNWELYIKDAAIIDTTLIYGAGNEPSTAEAFEADYYKWFGKQLTYEPNSAGELRPVKMNGIKTTGANNSWVSVNPIPITTLTGKLNGQGSSVAVFTDGMKRAGTVCDEIKKEGGVTKAIKRIGVVDLGTLTWTYNSSGDAATSNRPYFISNEIGNNVKPSTNRACPIYVSNKYVGRTEIGDKAFSYENNSYNNVVIADSAYSDAATFKTAMSGVILYCELATPEEYTLDAFDVQKMMLGANEVQKVYLGSDLVFEETN